MDVRGPLFCVLVAILAAAPARAVDDGPPEMRLPPDVIYRGGVDSPGPVVFSHSTHVPLADDRCIGCHPALFPILRPTGRVTHAEMRAGQKCGACHDGTAASGIDDDCEHCHESGETP